MTTHQTIAVGKASLVTLALLLPGAASADDVSCGIGDRVQGEFGGGEVGTIAEIGREAPHIGAYRITFRWSPGGEWYNPGTWTIHPEGSANRCVVGQASSDSARNAAEAASTHVDDSASASASAPATAAAAATTLPLNTASTERCRAGTEVVDRERRQGVVQGEANGLCVVSLTNGEVRSYLGWMLSAAGAPPTSAGGLATGAYLCSTEGAGNFKLQIVDADTYADRSGKQGSYTLDGEYIRFESGSLADHYSRLLGPGKFGLSTSEVRTFYVVCNRQS